MSLFKYKLGNYSFAPNEICAIITHGNVLWIHLKSTPIPLQIDCGSTNVTESTITDLAKHTQNFSFITSADTNISQGSFNITFPQSTTSFQ